MVVHIAADSVGNAKATSAANNEPWAKFVGSLQGWLIETVSVVVYRLRIRTVEEITEEAENLVREQFGRGKYDFLLNNCQHFASYCCTGQKMSVGANEFQVRIDQSGLG